MPPLILMVVVCALYSQWQDPKTGVEFERREVGGLFVGVAEMDEQTAQAYENRDGFEVMPRDEFVSRTTKTPEPEPTEPNTGDVLSDVAIDSRGAAAPPGPTAAKTDAKPDQTGKTPGPPPPPPSK